MQPLPTPGDEYSQGQMMGMLVIIQLLENAKDSGTVISPTIIQTIKNVAVESLSEYLMKPEEDVILLVNQQLETI